MVRLIGVVKAKRREVHALIGNSCYIGRRDGVG